MTWASSQKVCSPATTPRRRSRRTVGQKPSGGGGSGAPGRLSSGLVMRGGFSHERGRASPGRANVTAWTGASPLRLTGTARDDAACRTPAQPHAPSGARRAGRPCCAGRPGAGLRRARAGARRGAVRRPSGDRAGGAAGGDARRPGDSAAVDRLEAVRTVALYCDSSTRAVLRAPASSAHTAGSGRDASWRASPASTSARARVYAAPDARTLVRRRTRARARRARLSAAGRPRRRCSSPWGGSAAPWGDG